MLVIASLRRLRKEDDLGFVRGLAFYSGASYLLLVPTLTQQGLNPLSHLLAVVRDS